MKKKTFKRFLKIYPMVNLCSCRSVPVYNENKDITWNKILTRKTKESIPKKEQGSIFKD